MILYIYLSICVYTYTYIYIYIYILYIYIYIHIMRLCYQHYQCSTTGREHLHGYVQMYKGPEYIMYSMNNLLACNNFVSQAVEVLPGAVCSFQRLAAQLQMHTARFLGSLKVARFNYPSQSMCDTWASCRSLSHFETKPALGSGLLRLPRTNKPNKQVSLSYTVLRHSRLRREMPDA